MNLQESIRTILREEIDDQKHDNSKLIEKLLYTTFVIPNKDIVCGVEVKHPDDRGKPMSRTKLKYERYEIFITFIGGPGTKYWPVTQKVHDVYLDLKKEAYKIVYDFINIKCDITYKNVYNC